MPVKISEKRNGVKNKTLREFAVALDIELRREIIEQTAIAGTNGNFVVCAYCVHCSVVNAMCDINEIRRICVECNSTGKSGDCQQTCIIGARIADVFISKYGLLWSQRYMRAYGQERRDLQVVFNPAYVTYRGCLATYVSYLMVRYESLYAYIMQETLNEMTANNGHDVQQRDTWIDKLHTQYYTQDATVHTT